MPFLNLNTVLDGEAHVNVLQAETISQYIGDYLWKRYEIRDKRTDLQFPYRNAWEESVRSFEKAKEECEQTKLMCEQ